MAAQDAMMAACSSSTVGEIRQTWAQKPGRAGLRRTAETDTEYLRKRNPVLLGSRAEESLRYRGQQPRAVAACAVRIHTTAVRQALQRRQCMFNDVVIGRPA